MDIKGVGTFKTIFIALIGFSSFYLLMIPFKFFLLMERKFFKLEEGQIDMSFPNDSFLEMRRWERMLHLTQKWDSTDICALDLI